MLLELPVQCSSAHQHLRDRLWNPPSLLELIMSGTMLNELMELEPMSIVGEDVCGVVAQSR